MADKDFRQIERTFQTGGLSVPEYLRGLSRYCPDHPLTSLVSSPGAEAVLHGFDSLTQTEQQIGYGLYVLLSQSAIISEVSSCVLAGNGERYLDIELDGHYKKKQDVECGVLLDENWILFSESWTQGTQHYDQHSLDDLTLPFEKKLDLECIWLDSEPSRHDYGGEARERIFKMYNVNNPEEMNNTLIGISMPGKMEEKQPLVTRLLNWFKEKYVA